MLARLVQPAIDSRQQQVEDIPIVRGLQRHRAGHVGQVGAGAVIRGVGREFLLKRAGQPGDDMKSAVFGQLPKRAQPALQFGRGPAPVVSHNLENMVAHRDTCRLAA